MARAKVIRPKLPPAKTLEVTKLRQDIDYEHLREQVTLLQGHVSDQGMRIAQVEGSAGYWAGLSERVKKIEDEGAKPQTTIVQRAPALTIVWCFVAYTVALAAAGAAWLYAGHPLPF